MVSTSTNNPKKITSKTTTTPKPIYPTKRGSTVDARKIISQSSAQEHLQAVRMKHILFASKELAKESLKTLQSLTTTKGGGGEGGVDIVTASPSDFNFEELASKISSCAETREEGGEIGWVDLKKREVRNGYGDSIDEEEDGGGDLNEHLNLILPKEARNEVLQRTTKPGDVVMVSSSRGYHLVQISDVMVDVRKMANIKIRSWKSQKDMARKAGILSGALDPIQQQSSSLTSSEEEQLPLRERSGLTYKIETMGCQMNLADSERIEGQLQNLGITPFEPLPGKRPITNAQYPDVVVLNTCSIRDHAEQKVYSYIGPHAKRKREGKDVTIIVAGCVAQQEGESLLRRAPEVDLVMGPQYANRIGDLLEDVSNGNQVVATEASHIMEDSTKPRRQSTVAAWVNVIYGCNERCTYCIVPTTRGVEQSRPVDSIVQEVKDLVEQGYKEVTLLGQNIDAYGRDMIPKRKFSDLLRVVGATPGLQRLRFVTSHPRYMSLGVIDAVAETPTACWNFHVPYQSGSNAILSAMGRGHTREKYLQIIDRIRERLPDAAITADVIVGFPGETEQDFLDTLSIMEIVKFDSVNTAAYSPRPNTPAADWDNQLSEEVKQDRLRRINELNLKHAGERRARMLGRTVEVLVEERNVKSPTEVMGRTTHGYIVYLDGDLDKLKGELVNVRIDNCQTYYLSGKRVVEEDSTFEHKVMMP